MDTTQNICLFKFDKNRKRQGGPIGKDLLNALLGSENLAYLFFRKTE